MPKPHHYLDFCISVIIQSNDSSRMSENPSEGLSAFIKIFFSISHPYESYHMYSITVIQ